MRSRMRSARSSRRSTARQPEPISSTRSGEILEPLAALGGDLGLQRFEAPDQLAGQAAHLGDAGARPAAPPRASPPRSRCAEALRNDRLELGGGPRKRVERGFRPARARPRDRPGSAAPSRASARRVRARSSASRSMGPESTLGVGPHENRRARLRPAAGADRAAAAAATRRLAAPRLRTGHRRLFATAAFATCPDELPEDALVVVNDTRVVPARLRLRRPSGGEAEVLLLEPAGDGLWEALARPTKRLRPGCSLGAVELVEHLGRRALARPAGRASRRARRRCRRTSSSPSPTPSATRRSTPTRPAPRRRPTAGLHFTP